MMKRLMVFMLAIVLFLGSIDSKVFAAESISNVTENENHVALEEVVWPQSMEEMAGTEEVILQEWLSANGISENPEAPVITSVILSSHEGELKIRAWSASKDITEVKAYIYCKSGNSTMKNNLQLEPASGYYTSQVFVGKNVEKVRVVVEALDKEGRAGYKAAQINPQNSELEAKRVSNDLWIRFVDGKGNQNSEYTYTGKAIKPQVEIYEGTALLTEKKDYTLSYKNNKNAGNATIVVKGKGNYKQTAEVNFVIKPKSLSDTDIIVDDLSATINGKRQEKVPKITYNKVKLSNKNNKDFFVLYEDSGEGAYKEAGKYQVKVVGNGNYTGTIKVDYAIAPKLVKNLKVSKIPAVEYTGQKIYIDNLEVKDGKNPVPADKYTVRYLNNVDAGTASIILTGDGKEYAGSKTINFTIKGTALKAVTSVKGALPKEAFYSGSELTPKPNLTLGENKLVEGKDYTLQYQNNINVGTATMIITGKGQFTGAVKNTFKIKPFDIATDNGAKLKVVFEGQNANGQLQLPFAKAGVKPVEKVSFHGKLLTKGKDYTVVYQNNKTVTTEQTSVLPKVTVKMKGNFSGSFEKEFRIYRQELENTRISVADVVAGKKKFGWKSKVTVTDLDGKKLVAGKDYEKAISYYTDSNCQNEATEEFYQAPTTLWVKIKGLGSYEGSEAVVSYDIKGASIAKAKVKIIDQSYTSRPVTISNEDIEYVRLGNDILTAGQDFEIITDSYSSNVNKGTAKVTLKGLNQYGGTVTAGFKIVQKDFQWRENLEDNQQANIYDITLANTGVSEFVAKNATVSFTTNIYLEPATKEVVSAVKVNGTNYPLTKTGDNSYKAEITGKSTAGSMPVKVTAVTIGQQEYTVNWNGNSEVLKSEPTVENGVWSETDSGALEFNFNVKDDDNALLTGSRAVIYKDGQQVAEGDVKKGNNKIIVTSKTEGQYKAAVKLNYDLDSNSGNGKNETRDKEYTSQKTVGGITYNIRLQNTGVSEYVEKNEKIILTTGVSVEPAVTVEAIKVNGNDYMLTNSQNGLYRIEIPGSTNTGRMEIKVSAVKINGEDHSVTWSGNTEVLKAVPEVENTLLSDTAEGKKEFSFTIKDDDSALTTDSQVVISKDGQIIAQKAVQAGNNKIDFVPEAGKEYKVSVQLSYNRDATLNNGKYEESSKEVYSELITIPEEEPIEPDPVEPEPEEPDPEEPDPEEPDPGEPVDPVVPTGSELLELKGVTSVTLYYQGEEAPCIDISGELPQNPTDYTAKIESETARDLYVPVESFVKEGNKLRVIPKLSGFMHYEEEGGQAVKKNNLLLYADNVTVGIASVQELCDAVNAGETNITLTKDLDASAYTKEN
ncbi:MAG: hypothetical protein IKW28_07065, partial [Lachnospiraceae bacterium]|nr:hypothetical protein [Lachnospiraceae bacterium]